MHNPDIYQQTVTVEKQHLDEMNHVNNVQYLQWVQEVAKAHWETRAKPEWLEMYAWVALSHHIEYKKPALLGEELLLQTHVHEFTGVRSHRFVRIKNAKTGDLISQAATWWCMINKENGKPTRVSRDMINYFESGNT